MAVERIKKRQEIHRLGQLRLYRDELEAIARELAKFGPLEFTVNGEVSGTEPEDFAKVRDELPERLKRVRMEATRGESSIRVELGLGAEVVLIEPDISASGVLTRIKEICAPRRIRVYWPLVLATLLIDLLLLGGYLVISYLKHLQQEETVLYGAVVILMLLLAVAAVPSNSAAIGSAFMAAPPASSRDDILLRSIILNVPRAERPTFGQRLVADGGVSAFWTVVGLVFGGAIGYLVNQMPGL
ncbi:hypothetical protein [Nocardiopsis sp. LOL_012]|uniref:hypothetical protein n=1 Tax=Nocardiopsis sp. LOL_012 TaxID=3345409 RepID=UPI003A8BFC12